MHDADALLLAALAAAPRRFRLPPLPADLAQASAAGTAPAIAFCIEAARAGRARGVPAPESVAALFMHTLAALIGQALQPQGGDPAFQALVLHSQDADVQAHVRLAAQADADRRALRAAVDALAHPGKLRGLPDSAPRDALARLHRLAAAGDWPTLREALADAETPAPLRELAAHPALARLEQRDVLRAQPAVQRYLALCGQRGPRAGSDAAANAGRASARLGEQAERETVAVFAQVAALLQPLDGGRTRWRVVRGLRPPPGFPGASHRAKDEWDVALLRQAPQDAAAQVALLAEVKASAAAATSDLPRLLRGLERLAQAAPAPQRFASADGPVDLCGDSLAQLAATARTLPARVIYCCCASASQPTQPLAAAAKAVLLAEPACLAFARRRLQGDDPPPDDLAPVWHELAQAPRLRAALHQDETARAARAAMLHPQDLLQAVSACVPLA